jgi:hypothetical protein
MPAFAEAFRLEVDADMRFGRAAAVSAAVLVWDGREGVFGAADLPTRRALSAEQVRFAWNVLMFDPIGQAYASLVNWMRQLTTFGRLTDFSYGENMRNAAVCGVLSGVFDRYQARVVWLVPLLALVWGLQLLTSRCLATAGR